MQRCDLDFDKQHIWHPYTSMTNPLPCYPVSSANKEILKLSDGRELIDGMSSWWAAIHGYNHPVLNQAMQEQIGRMSHVMFGGLTHQPAIDLCKKLVAITPMDLECVFLADSGSVAVEVALKMACQYWQAKGETRSKFVALKHAYHGDTFGAMSVCDPTNSMHSLYHQILPQHHFADAPQSRFDEHYQTDDCASLASIFARYHHEIAAVVVEPIVQGAGGMRIYHPQYLIETQKLCKQYGVLLIADEIATGFGRTGRWFACEHAKISPDILCLGKGLTGGYLTLSATLTTRNVANTISSGSAHCFMHGPTFMGNPLACAVANASIDLLLSEPTLARVGKIETLLKQKLLPLKSHPRVADVRVLGAIGVVEVTTPVKLQQIQAFFVANGVWIRPFGRLIYIMPPYIIDKAKLNRLCDVIEQVLDQAVFE